LAENEFPVTETGKLVNKNPEKLLCAGGANDIKSSPHDSWSRTQSRRRFPGNNINVAAAVVLQRYTLNISIQMHLCKIINNTPSVVQACNGTALTLLYAKCSNSMSLKMEHSPSPENNRFSTSQ
jgi:hypothetical protein